MGQHQLEVLGDGDRPRLILTPWCSQELVKHTQDATEKENLRLALDAMRVSEQVLLVTHAGSNLSASTSRLIFYPWLWKGLAQGGRQESLLLFPHSQDLAQCVNEVKRDNETLRQITNFQLSIENLVRGGAGWAKGVDLWAGCRSSSRGICS